MANRNTIALFVNCLGVILGLVANLVQAQQSLWFGSIKVDGRRIQARFEIDSSLHSIIYAPYGRTPTAFTNLKTTGQEITFDWLYDQHSYKCTLSKQKGNEYSGTCSTPG